MPGRRTTKHRHLGVFRAKNLRNAAVYFDMRLGKFVGILMNIRFFTAIRWTIVGSTAEIRDDKLR
jgi:hypothetical protein